MLATLCRCYIGKKRLEAALAQFPDVSFDVTWRPFFLNKDAPMEGVVKMDYYKAKFGEARVAQMLPHMTQVFADEGLQYSLGGLTGSTMDSHRLAEWAKEEAGLEKQDALMTAMFDSYFCEEKYLGGSCRAPGETPPIAGLSGGSLGWGAVCRRPPSAHCRGGQSWVVCRGCEGCAGRR